MVFLGFFWVGFLLPTLPSGRAHFRRPEPRDPVPDVPPSHRLHGHAPQERARGEEVVQVCKPEDGRGHCNAVRHVSRGGPVRDGRLHEGDVVVVWWCVVGFRIIGIRCE